MTCVPGCSECTDWFSSPLNTHPVTAENPICPIRSRTCVRFPIQGGGIQRQCPECGELLGYQVYHPPIPKVIREWTFGDPDESHSNVVIQCPVCDGPLPIDETIDQEAWTSW